MNLRKYRSVLAHNGVKGSICLCLRVEKEPTAFGLTTPALHFETAGLLATVSISQTSHHP